MREPLYKKFPLFYVIAGTIIMSISVSFFINPSNLYSGGFTGISQLIVNLFDKYTDIKLNLGLINFLLPSPLFILAWKKLSKKFVVYTFVSIVLQSICFAVFPILFPNANILEGNILACAIFGGILSGLGNGLVLKVGGSSGGALMLFQYINIKTSIPVGTLQLFLNCVIVAVAAVLFEVDLAVYTIILYVIVSLVINNIHNTYNYIRVEIVTEKGTDMISGLLKNFNHGVTHFNGVGDYTKHPKEIIYVIISNYELNAYLKVIKEIDPKSFVTISQIKMVAGNFKKNVIS